MNSKEYARLTKEYAEEQYGEYLYPYQDEVEKEAEERKERLLKEKVSSRLLDLSKADLTTIKSELPTSRFIEIGKFNITVRKYYTINTQSYINLDIYEYVKENKIASKLNITKDVRFQDREWIKYFKNALMGGFQIPLETAVQIIRWLQVADKISAFF